MNLALSELEGWDEARGKGYRVFSEFSTSLLSVTAIRLFSPSRDLSRELSRELSRDLSRPSEKLFRFVSATLLPGKEGFFRNLVTSLQIPHPRDIIILV